MHLSPRFIRFCLIGAANTLIDAGLFTLLRGIGWNIVTANLVSTSTGILVSYLLNSRFTFQAPWTGRRQLVLFILINIVGLWLLQPLCIYLLLSLSYGLHVIIAAVTANFIANLSATAITFLWNYYMYRRFVYAA